MATSLPIDKVSAVGSETTKKAAAAKRSQEVASRANRELVELFGKLELDDDYDYKRERDRR